MTTDRLTRLYHDELARPGSALAAIDLNTPRLTRLAELGFTYLSRPLFFGKEEIRRFEDDLMRVVDLLLSLPQRIFDGDVERTCRALGISPDKAELIRSLSRHGTPRFGRIDAYHDGESLKILEFNATSGAGGQEWVGSLAEAMTGFEAFRSFAAEHGLDHVDTSGLLVDELRAAARVTGAADPVVALVEGPGGLEVYGRAWRPLHRILRERGLDARLAEITDLSVRDGAVRLGEDRVDVVYRVFDLAQVVDHPQARRLAEQLRDAHEAGTVALWTPLETEIHRNKLWLAYLSDPSLGAGLTAEERALVDRVLPWTRAIGADTATEDPDLWQDVLDRREQLILKPNEGFGGQGITFGWLVDDAEWHAAVLQAAQVGAIVQRRVVPREDWVYNPATGRTEAWDVCWGLFWMPSGFAGGGGRLVPSGEPVTIDRSRKRMASLYLYPDVPGEADRDGASGDAVRAAGSVRAADADRVDAGAVA